MIATATAEAVSLLQQENRKINVFAAAMILIGLGACDAESKQVANLPTGLNHGKVNS